MRRTRSSRLPAVLCAFAISFASVQRARGEDQATSHAKAGFDAYQQGDYQEAADAFERAYRADPVPELLFVWARAVRKTGDCARAIELLRMFLATAPPVNDERAATLAIDECREELGLSAAQEDNDSRAELRPNNQLQPDADVVAEDGGRDAGTSTAQPVDTVSFAPETQIVHKPWYTDGVGHALLGSALVAGGVATGFALAARQKKDEALRAEQYTAFEQRAEKVEMWRTTSAAFGGAGAVLLAAAILRYSLADRTTSAELRSSDSATSLSISARF